MAVTTETVLVTQKRLNVSKFAPKRNKLKEFAKLKIDQTIGYLSFFSTVWFLLSPIFLALFVLSIFGFVHAVAFICTCVLYNYLGDKVHPRGLVGRKWKEFHAFMGYQWEPFRKMMPINIVKLTPNEFQPPRKFMFCYHPHGVLFLGAATVGNNFDKIFPGLNAYHLMSSVCFLCPIFRQYCIWNGCIPATKECANTAVNEHGVSLSVIPGGLAEMLQADATPRHLLEFEQEACINSNPNDDGGEKKTYVLYLKSRKGFVKLAIQFGLDLVPIFTFGEIETYRQIRWGLKWRLRLSRFLTIPITWIWGQYFLLPFKKELNLVVGAPLAVEREENPSVERVEQVHKQYIEALCKMFEENKAKYGCADARLIIM